MSEMKSATVTFHVTSPFITGNGDAPFGMLDATLPRDDDDRIFFNKSLVRGVFKDALLSMSARAENGLCGFGKEKTKHLLKTLFGTSSADADEMQTNDKTDLSCDAYKPARRNVEFGRLVSAEVFVEPKQRNQELVYTRTERDDVLGSVVQGSLQEIELVARVGQAVEFQSRILFNQGVDAEACLKLLKLAARAICSIGGNKSAGFGRVASVPEFSELEHFAANSGLGSSVQVSQNMISGIVLLKLSEPFLVSAERVGINGFVGSDVIPGGAIKAALADMLGSLNEEESKALSETIIDHAFPVYSGQNQAKVQTVLPKSIASLEGGKTVINLGQHSGAFVLMSDEKPVPQAMKLSADWKPSEEQNILRGQYKILSGDYELPLTPNRSLMVRTAIDGDTSAAKTEDGSGQLFSYEMVNPKGRDVSDEETSLLWQFNIQTKSSNFFEKLIDILKSGVFIGKTQAPAHAVKLEEKKSVLIAPLATSAENLIYQVVLVSDCVMFEALEMENKPGILRKLYTAYFKHVFGNGVTLRDFHAEQKLAGGYVALRYRGGRENYMPWCLTSQGSSFTLQIASTEKDSFESKLQEVFANNLPLSNSVKKRTWEDCPFVPENGYGSIVINPLKAHVLPAGVICIGGGDAD